MTDRQFAETVLFGSENEAANALESMFAEHMDELRRIKARALEDYIDSRDQYEKAKAELAEYEKLKAELLP